MSKSKGKGPLPEPIYLSILLERHLQMDRNLVNRRPHPIPRLSWLNMLRTVPRTRSLTKNPICRRSLSRSPKGRMSQPSSSPM